ncbi:MAG: NifB/NifX family molybdenum-iron cluster-binding protein [Candidatus Thorarchaeota archaeon]
MGDDPRFGRCSWSVIVDTDTDDTTAVADPGAQAVGGAGIQAAQLVVSHHVDGVLTGNFGPHAMSALRAAGIQVLDASASTVREAVDRYIRGEARPISTATLGQGNCGGAGHGRGTRPAVGHGRWSQGGAR